MNECGCVCCRFRAFAIMHRLCGDYAWIRRVCVYSRVCVCLHVRLSLRACVLDHMCVCEWVCVRVVVCVY